MSQSADPAAIPFDRSLAAKAEEVQQVSPLVRRVIANNGGPFTFTGTCSYIVGHGEVAIIDPGPDDRAHIEALVSAVRDETVRYLLVTHAHRDHCAAAAALAAATGAPVLGCRAGPTPAPTPIAPVPDLGGEDAYRPDRVLGDGEVVSVPGFTLETVETPGHAAAHLAFALPEERALFTGDHVMAWSTTVVAPPDGSMKSYRASLERLLGREDDIYWPGHGGPVRDPRRFVVALLRHRRDREAAILRRLAAGDATVSTLVGQLYRALDPRLQGGAALSILAHLEELVGLGLVSVEGPLTLKARFRLA